MKIRTFTILLVTGMAVSLSGLASATNAGSAQAASSMASYQHVQAPHIIKASAKTAAKRRIVRKALPSENRVMKVYSDKSLIDVSGNVSSKSKIVRPATTKTRTPNLYGG